MRRLGISIYPEKDIVENIIEYIKKAGFSGFSRIFSCLLSVNKSKEEIIHDFREINLYAKSLGFETILATSEQQNIIAIEELLKKKGSFHRKK